MAWNVVRKKNKKQALFQSRQSWIVSWLRWLSLTECWTGNENAFYDSFVVIGAAH
jgi:hypothetical protein